MGFSSLPALGLCTILAEIATKDLLLRSSSPATGVSPKMGSRGLSAPGVEKVEKVSKKCSKSAQKVQKSFSTLFRLFRPPGPRGPGNPFSDFF